MKGGYQEVTDDIARYIKISLNGIRMGPLAGLDVSSSGTLYSIIG